MSEKLITTAVLGLNSQGKNLAKMASESGRFAITAVADNDMETAVDFAGQFDGCESFDDFRQLVMQNKPDLLIVAEPMHNAIEHVKTAIKNKINILKLLPGARDFAEISQIKKLCKQNSVEYFVADTDKYLKSRQKLSKLLSENSETTAKLIAVEWTEPAEFTEEQLWRKDPKLAGGGVVLHEAYGVFSLLVENFDVPEQVFTLDVSNAPDKQQQTYLTEDSTAISIRFADSLAGNLVLSRTIGPSKKVIRIFFQDKVIEYRPDSIEIKDFSGEILGKYSYDDNESSLREAMLTNLADKITLNDENAKISTINEHISTMAVIEAIYLSARTTMPEMPERIIQLKQH